MLAHYSYEYEYLLQDLEEQKRTKYKINLLNVLKYKRTKRTKIQNTTVLVLYYRRTLAACLSTSTAFIANFN